MRKHPQYRRPLIPILLLALTLPILASWNAAYGDTVTIAIEQAALRSDQQFYAPVVATVNHGARLEVLAQSNGWFKVAGNGVQGWLHQSAVASGAERRVELRNRNLGGGNYSQDEVTLAGKGFSAEVEKQYRSSHSRADYASVDWMEQQQVEATKAIAFARAGKIHPRTMPNSGAQLEILVGDDDE